MERSEERTGGRAGVQGYSSPERTDACMTGRAVQRTGGRAGVPAYSSPSVLLEEGLEYGSKGEEGQGEEGNLSMEGLEYSSKGGGERAGGRAKQRRCQPMRVMRTNGVVATRTV